MRWRNTIAAGLVFVALLSWVLTNERRRVPAKDEVFAIDAAQARALTIQRKDEEPITLEKRGDDWFITQPFQGLASKDEAERLVKQIAELVPRGTREGVDLGSEDYGLSDPDLVATLTYDGRKATVYVGAETPLGGERYAKVSGARRSGGDELLYVVSASLRTTLWKDPEELREKKVARFETDDVQQVSLKHGDTQVVAVRRAGEDEPSEQAKWALTVPLATDADEWNVRQVINNVRDLRAVDFLDENKSDAELGLDKPQAMVTLTMKDGNTLTISFGKVAEAEVGDPPSTKKIVYVRTSEREDEVLMLNADALDKVRKTAFDLRDKSVLRFDRNEVTRIVVERRQGMSFTVARRPDGWFVEKPKAVPARQSKIDDLLWDLEDLSAVKFVTEHADQAKLRECGLAVPQVAITIHLRSGEPLRVLIGDKTDEGNYYAKTGDSDQIVEISQFLYNDLPTKLEEIEKTEPDFDQQHPQNRSTSNEPPPVGDTDE